VFNGKGIPMKNITFAFMNQSMKRSINSCMKRAVNGLIFGLILLGSVTTQQVFATGEPSEGAKDMAGAKGTIEFKPTDWVQGKKTWWKDSDGVAPGVAGCHIGTDEQGAANGRMFGEVCLASGLLVESNPGQDKVHGHADDRGHPDTFDCNAWCVGEGKQSGQCEVAAAPPCEQSAMCACQ
jgi:hypothetical protein